MASIQYKRGTYDKYKALAVRDANTLYFLTDIGSIMLGDNDVTNSVVLVTNYDGQAGGISVDNAFEGKLYINAQTLECRVKDSDSWAPLIPGYIAAGTDVVEGNNAKVATVKALREFVATQIANIGNLDSLVSDLAWTAENGSGTGKLVVTKGGETSQVVLDGIPFSINYEEATYKLKISVYGSETVKEIQLPKPGGIKSGRYEANYDLPDDTKGPALVLVVTNEDGDSEVVIPAAELMTAYTGGATGTMTIEIAANNVITGNVKIDPEAGNAIVTTANGLRVDVSDKLANYGAGNASELLLSDAAGKAITRSGKTILKGTTLGEDENTIANAAAVAAAISAAVNTINGELNDIKTRLTAAEGSLQNKIDSMGTGNADELVLSTATGAVARSTKVIGGATLETNPSASVVATEAAVAAATAKAVVDATPTWSDME